MIIPQNYTLINSIFVLLPYLSEMRSSDWSRNYICTTYPYRDNDSDISILYRLAIKC
jgi:hypothetical protein